MFRLKSWMWFLFCGEGFEKRPYHIPRKAWDITLIALQTTGFVLGNVYPKSQNIKLYPLPYCASITFIYTYLHLFISQ